MLKGKRIVLGVTGSIAAYKAAELASQLVQAGAEVYVIMTASAQQFIAPLTFQTLTGRPVITDLFRQLAELNLPHIALAEAADAVVIAPATANILAKLAQGLADDMLTCTVLATRAPLLIAPAMDANMYDNPATQANIARLQEHGHLVLQPGYGRLASGKLGPGRLLEPEVILGHLRALLGRQGDLAGLRVLVTAGGTQEAIDPVRLITNRSSGKMGYALAEAARDRGARVTLISAPTSLPTPAGLTFVAVESAQQMQAAVLEKVQSADVLLMAAAVADYRPEKAAAQKLKRSGKALQLRLEPNPDILAEVRHRDKRLVVVGFAAESENLLANAQAKLQAKGLDLVVANDITAEGSGFGSDTNKVLLVDRKGYTDLPLLPKYEVAQRILDVVRGLVERQKKER